mmetsp:Transcript_9345/g.17443  ORF Transcript_9345/g.17443 Transcript_9345/m.17443 type:complete len:235 (+) Transcript_9345:1042-1746(+)
MKLALYIYSNFTTRQQRVLLLVNKLSSSLVDCCKAKQDNGEEKKWLRVREWNTRLTVELGQGALSGNHLSDQGGSKAKLRHSPDEQLVVLGETDSANAKELSWGEERDAWVLEGTGRAHLLLFHVLNKLPLSWSEGGKDVEGNEGKHERLRIEERQTSLEVELGQGTLPGQELSQEGGGEAKHSHPSNEELVRLGEAKTNRPDDVVLGLEELPWDPDFETLCSNTSAALNLGAH